MKFTISGNYTTNTEFSSCVMGFSSINVVVPPTRVVVPKKEITLIKPYNCDIIMVIKW